ncbi:COesterase domain-containing protein [Rhizoctonia solani AG-1 IA]|uniref:COesterase domain-containing protein n=1 Tax=Thanatephorus cucumeris (strain AG1-IA) TaxID=983506 RepID=L8X0E0_THACA|nr:COesterase domain-containing protein [Rhizoctonia solani AG-1 IA]
MKHLEAGVPVTKHTKKRVSWAITLALAATCAFFYRTVTCHSRTSASLYFGSRPQVRISGITHVGYYDRAHRLVQLDCSFGPPYLGIPYAQPPTGERRFRPPLPISVPHNLSHAVIQANSFGPSCPQSTPVPYPISEDCLTLNVWVPDVPAPVTRSLGEEIAKGLPVLVWICGTRQTLWSRLQSISWLVPVGAEPSASGAHNLGLLDQRLALEWIHKNIALFGGDPEKITIFGESAGSVSVGAQMSYQRGNTGGIFRAAIMQSGTPSTMSTSILSSRTRQTTYDRIAQHLGCPVSGEAGWREVRCVQSANTNDLQRAEWKVLEIPDKLKATDPAPIAFAPSIVSSYPNDPFFFDGPDRIAEKHQFANVPLIIGGTLDEGTDFVPSLEDTGALRSYFTTTQPGLTFGVETPAARKAFDTFVSMYPDDPAAGSPFGTGNETWGKGRGTKRGAAIFGDWLFEKEVYEGGCQGWFTSLVGLESRPPRIWYLSSIRFRSYQYAQPGYWAPEFGVGHFADVQMIFRWFDTHSDPEMIRLSDTILSFWFVDAFESGTCALRDFFDRLNFVYYLDPSPRGSRRKFFSSWYMRIGGVLLMVAVVPYWPQYGSEALSLQLKIHNYTLITDDFRAEPIEWLMKEKQLKRPSSSSPSRLNSPSVQDRADPILALDKPVVLILMSTQTHVPSNAQLDELFLLSSQTKEISRKFEGMIPPVKLRGPVRILESTLLKEELLQVPDCHELPLALPEPER